MNIANWRTTIWGALSLVSAFVLQYPELIDGLVDAKTAKLIFSLSMLVSGFIAFANAKDRQVTGNGANTTPQRIAQPDGTNKTLYPAIALFAVLTLALTGCTEYDLSKGTGRTWGDSQGFTQTYHGDSIHWDNLSHSAVWDASGRFLGNVSSGVAETLIAHGVAKAVTRGDVNGVQLIAATLPPATQKFISRRTNRITPTPTPKP